MKQCGKCKEKKPLSDFNKRGDGHQSYCRECQRGSKGAWFQENKDRVVSVKTAYRKLNRDKIKAYLSEHPCVDCGEDDWMVLEFDHREQSLKLLNVSDMLDHGWKNIQAEIDKCDVRCANCHRRRTYTQLGWYALLV